VKSEIVISGDYSYEFSGSWSNHPIGTAHFHPFYEIYFLLNGEVSYLIENDRYDISEGYFVCIPPNTYHNVLRKQRVDRKRVVMYFSEKAMNDFFSAIPNLSRCFEKRVILTREYKNNIFDSFNLLVEEKDFSKNNPAMIKALLTQILVMMERECISNGKISSFQNNDILSKHILEMSEYINEHYSEDISLNSLSKMFYLNPSYISRSFKMVHGLSFSEYRNMIRLQQAAKLLATTKLSLSEIANECGFKTANGFSSVFKSHTGFSPTAYKKRIIDSDK